MRPLTRSQELFSRAKGVIPGGVHSPVRSFRGVGGIPPFIESARGMKLFDVDGNSYIDFCMSWGPLILGHSHDDVVAVVSEAVKRGSSFGAADPYSLELAEFITQNIPWIDKVRFVSSGTEAVMSALRVARAATGRNRILKFDGCYHGHSDGLLVKAGSGLTELSQPDSAGIPNSVAKDTISLPLNQLSEVERVFSEYGKDIAAVIVEPIPANNGLLIPKDDFIPKLMSIARSAGALVIFDEVITGFRLAFGGYTEWTSIEPDLVTYGKIIGGGFPVGAYAGKAEFMDLVAPSGPVYQAGTLSANPVAMSAGLATLRILKATSPYEALERRTQNLADRIEKVALDHSEIPLKIQNVGSMFWPVFGAVQTGDGVVRSPMDVPALHKEQFTKIYHHFLSLGYYLPPSAFEVSFLLVAHKDEDIDGFVKAFASFLGQKESL